MLCVKQGKPGLLEFARMWWKGLGCATERCQNVLVNSMPRLHRCVTMEGARESLGQNTMLANTMVKGMNPGIVSTWIRMGVTFSKGQRLCNLISSSASAKNASTRALIIEV